MADNVTANAGAGGATFRTDDDGTAHWPYVKLAWGADNTQTVVATGAGAVPIQDGGNTITVDGTVAATQSGTWNVNNVSGTISLPTGAATAAKQPALGTAGTASADVITVQGIASMTALKVDGTGGSFPVTDSGGTLSVDDGAGALTVDNAGTFAVQVDGDALTALQLIDDIVRTDDGAFTPGTNEVAMAGFFADETSTDSVDEGDAGAARMTLDRKVIVTPQPHTAGGLSIFRSLDLDETEEDVKTAAGQVYSMWVTNTATATRFVKFYNATAANVTVGTTTPVITIGIPGNSSDDISGHFAAGGMGIAFDTAISVAATTGVADNDTGAPGANEIICNIFFK